MLLQLPTLRGGRPDRDQRTVFELHVPQPDADVLPEGVSVLEGHRPRLHGAKVAGPMLPDHLLPGRYVIIKRKHLYTNKPSSWFGCYSAGTPVDQLDHADADHHHRDRMARQLRMHDERGRILPRRGAGECRPNREERGAQFCAFWFSN